ncbi:MAG: AMP-binding protein [Candidatus Cloacimonetes bacterium]|nr:AMP-binding protein [Candidatus Cloacimonadota bacterium]MCF7813376.1 AMP-binding protein [Candidatus Cloacimonadota bacterium]MCF7867499.1 AMP-binding protein [Candidatus Cloacimonadota bacterium]MCF7882998.1 AMP-binding protein [Candidatus Cloacimonadota bacterium]
MNKMPLNETLGELIERIASKFPDNEALVYPDHNIRLTYKEFNAEVDKIAKSLIALNIKKGDHVAIWSTNVPQWPVLMFALAKVGAVLVTVNTNYRSHELEYLLKQSDSKAIFLIDKFKTSEYFNWLKKVLSDAKWPGNGKVESEKLPMLKNVIMFDHETTDHALGYDDFSEMGAHVSDDDLNKIKEDLDEYDVVNMQYTSGTTGFPKGVMLTHHNIANNAYLIGEQMKLTEKDRMCIPVPFFHCFGCVLGILAAVTHGTTMLPTVTFDAEEVLKLVDSEKCTVLHGVPTMFIAELGVENRDQYDTSTLRTGIMAGSPCPVEVMNQVINEMHCDQITIAYGLTENSPVITMTSVDDDVEHRTTTVGKVLSPMQMKVMNLETEEECKPGEQGEVIMAGECVMSGYYKMKKENEMAIRDGWLHSGDLGVKDEDGYLKITGRIKDMIIRGGENVYPREIEEFLYTHPKVRDVQVIGVPDKNFGEQILAAIKLKEGETATVEEIKEYCQENIARHNQPYYVVFVDEYPMTASGKIQKFKLRDQLVEKLSIE